ncbi:MAG: PRC-barrel domain-containing protein [Verrucomicrobiia bacterium]
MNTKKLFLPAALAAITGLVATTSGVAQSVLNQQNLTNPDRPSERLENRDRTDAQPSASNPEPVSEQDLKKKVTNINKASTFIGMDVKNLKDETLGEVNDLAFDPESGKIAYAVLSVGGFLGLNEKYIAVPLNALRPAPGADHVLLDADKERLDRAPGFAKNNWPDLDTPAWGAAAGFARGSGSDAQAVGRPAAAQQEGTAAGGSEERQQFSGTISKIDKDARTLTVRGEGAQSGERTFRIDQNAQISRGDDNDAQLDSLQEGSRVSIEYSGQGHQPVAKAVRAQEPGTRPDALQRRE